MDILTFLLAYQIYFFESCKRLGDKYKKIYNDSYFNTILCDNLKLNKNIKKRKLSYIT